MKMLQNYYRINKVTGIGITVLSDGTYEVSACSVSADAKDLTIDKKISGLKQISKLEGQIPKASAICVNLSGKGVITKQVEGAEPLDQARFGQLLPNAKLTDFYVQHFVSGMQSFITIIRKSEADKWIALLQKEGLSPLMLSMGPFPVYHITPQLNVYEQRLVFHGHVIHKNEQQQWTDYRYEPDAAAVYPIKVDLEAMPESIIIPYAAAFQLVLAGQLDPVKADVETLESAFKTEQANRKFKVQGLIVLGIFFILLLANFIVFNWLYTDNQRLADKVSTSSKNVSELQSLNTQVSRMEALTDSLGWDGGINKARLIDQIAALMPAAITWQSVSINPAAPERSRTQKQPVFLKNKLMIEGRATQVVSVNEWLQRIKTKSWVKRAEMKDYNFNNELNTGEFTIILDY
jgi:hypothetical protein